MTILIPHVKVKLKAAVFDFDGTISTLRHGWERVMAPLMEEYISGGSPTPEIKALVADYIDKSTGIQTIHQMKWLTETVRKFGMNPSAPSDPWFYKDEYNRRLMEEVAHRRDAVISGASSKTDWLVAGAGEFLEALHCRGLQLYTASGTDEADVRAEAAALDVARYFEHGGQLHIEGAKTRSEGCSKEEMLRRLISAGGDPRQMLVVGDGKVEIALGREFGTLTLGVASDEEKRSGVNPNKLRRLTSAGAHAIIGDFTALDEILYWAGI